MSLAIWDHTVTCHLTQVNTPHLNPSQTGRYLAGLKKNSCVAVVLHMYVPLNGYYKAIAQKHAHLLYIEYIEHMEGIQNAVIFAILRQATP